MVPDGVITGLVVDDDEAVRMLHAEAFRRAGFETVQAATGRVALEMAKAHVPDFIITDIQMPELGGIELCRLLRSEPSLSHVRIVVVSGVAAVEGAEAFRAGCDAVIEKPCSPSMLVATIRRLPALRQP
jgi:CheY-like chemotaxis protein